MPKSFLIAIVCVCQSLLWDLSLASDERTSRGATQILNDINEVVLIDFTSDASISAWWALNDTVMGGISSSRMEQSGEGKAVFTGNVSLENNGGFASVRGPQIQQSLGEFEGIAVRVKGDGKRYNCELRTDDLFDGIIHQAPFETKSGVWQQQKIPFTDFVPTYHGERLSEDKRVKREYIKSVGFQISDNQAGPFRLEIDWLKAYR